MKPLFHPRLVNDPFGDPGLYVDFLFERRALLFDLGDLSPLSARQLLRVDHAFVSHTHMDHFAGFDALLRVLLGRPKVLHLFGPPGFIERVEHKLAAYTWNLVANYESDFVVRVTEVSPTAPAPARSSAAARRSAASPSPPRRCRRGVLLDEETFQVRAAFLDHQIPCLAFALEEKFHVNVWKSGLEELGLPTGPWLRDLKSAVARGEPDASRSVRWREDARARSPSGELKEKVLRIVPGQKIAYVTDAGYTPANAEAIVDLARGADVLFIETAFTHEEERRAAEKHHLTAWQAGWLARAAGARRLVPFHFSPKHTDEGDRLLREAMEAFSGLSICPVYQLLDEPPPPKLPPPPENPPPPPPPQPPRPPPPSPGPMNQPPPPLRPVLGVRGRISRRIGNSTSQTPASDQPDGDGQERAQEEEDGQEDDVDDPAPATDGVQEEGAEREERENEEAKAAAAAGIPRLLGLRLRRRLERLALDRVEDGVHPGLDAAAVVVLLEVGDDHLVPG